VYLVCLLLQNAGGAVHPSLPWRPRCALLGIASASRFWRAGRFCATASASYLQAGRAQGASSLCHAFRRACSPGGAIHASSTACGTMALLTQPPSCWRRGHWCAADMVRVPLGVARALGFATGRQADAVEPLLHLAIHAVFALHHLPYCHGAAYLLCRFLPPRLARAAGVLLYRFAGTLRHGALALQPGCVAPRAPTLAAGGAPPTLYAFRAPHGACAAPGLPTLPAGRGATNMEDVQRRAAGTWREAVANGALPRLARSTFKVTLNLAVVSCSVRTGRLRTFI